MPNPRLRRRGGLIVTFALLVMSITPIVAAAAPQSTTVDVSSTTPGWTQTNVLLKQGQKYTVKASGSWTVDYRNFPPVGPAGYDATTDSTIYQGCKIIPAPYATLLGSTGGGQAFAVGAGGNFTASADGVLSLRINDADACLGDNQGSVSAEVTPGPSPINKYVALGDSYSSGQGNPPFISESDKVGTNECHRSFDAYPKLLKNTLGIADQNFTFSACSGAIMADFFKKFGEVGQWTDIPQLNTIASTTDFITLTLGGNDSSFALVLDTCVDNIFFLHPRFEALCIFAANTFAERGRKLLENGGKITIQPRKDSVPGTTWKFCDNQCVNKSPASSVITLPNFSGLLEQIHNRAPNARIRVLLYPRLFSNTLTDKCIVTEGTQFSISLKSAQALNDLTDQLNTTIANQVNQVKTKGVDIMPIDPNTPTLTDHRLCASGNAWFNGVSLVKEYSFHPNASGQLYFANLVKSTL